MPNASDRRAFWDTRASSSCARGRRWHGVDAIHRASIARDRKREYRHLPDALRGLKPRDIGRVNSDIASARGRVRQERHLEDTVADIVRSVIRRGESDNV